MPCWKRWGILGVLVGALVLTACVPLVPAPDDAPDDGGGLPPPVEEPAGRPATPQPPPVVPRPAPPPAPTKPAVAALLRDAWAHYRASNYDSAIAVAERAQRIDARNPEVYLVLASSHAAQGDAAAARGLARKGLGFSAAGSSIRARLQQLLD